MAGKDPYEALASYYELMLGPLPMKEQLLDTIQQTVSPAELEIFLLLPLAGYLPASKLQHKASHAGIGPERLQATLQRLQREGFILAYKTPEGRAYERGNPAFMTEQQVRKQEASPQRTAYARFFRHIIEEATDQVPNKTPYYRAVPVESTLPGAPQDGPPAGRRRIPVGEPIADPSGALPVDVISAVVAEQERAAVAECYCRKVKVVLGDPCHHPLETCLVVNELADSLVESGIARPIDTAEALQIVRASEAAGLVHHVDNCEGQFRSVCNCCSCACIILATVRRGQTNAAAPSRYLAAFDEPRCSQCADCVAVCHVGAAQLDGVIRFDAARCIGCGLCASACPEGALQMALRTQPPAIFPSYDKLMGRIGREALIAVVVGRARSRVRRLIGR